MKLGARWSSQCAGHVRCNCHRYIFPLTLPLHVPPSLFPCPLPYPICISNEPFILSYVLWLLFPTEEGLHSLDPGIGKGSLWDHPGLASRSWHRRQPCHGKHIPTHPVPCSSSGRFTSPYPLLPRISDISPPNLENVPHLFYCYWIITLFSSWSIHWPYLCTHVHPLY